MHDKSGKPLKIGDLVMVPCRVKDVSPDNEFCNITVETEYAMPGNGTKNVVVLNTKQVHLQDWGGGIPDDEVTKVEPAAV